MKLLLTLLLLAGFTYAKVPDPPINYLMEGKYEWRIEDPNGIPGKAILYYDLPPHFDGIPDLVLAFNVYSVDRKPCLRKNVMTKKFIILNSLCGTSNPLVYVLERPNYAARAFRNCEINKRCPGWVFIRKN